VKISGVTYRHPFANTTGGTGAGGQVLSGRSFQFDGVADRVACDAAAAANTLDWDGVKRWTVSCWFKAPGTAYATLWSMCPTIPGANRFLEVASYYSGGVGRIRLQARALLVALALSRLEAPTPTASTRMTATGTTLFLPSTAH
jgi:hypothetical protein